MMKKILAIDDQNDNLIAIKGFLKNFMPNCKLFLALSGKEGIAIAQKEQPDTILLDIIMPEMDGFEVCKILKQNELTKYIPIIMLSALGQDTDSRVKGLNLGADAFLAKPFVPIELQAQINVMLRIKEAEDEIKSEKRDLEKKIENRTKELVENEEKYRNVVERATDGICIVQDNIVKFVNPRLIKIWGGNAENVIGRPFTNFVYPENIKKLTLYYQKRLAGEDVPSIYETTLLHDSGRKVYVEVSSGIITYLGKAANLVIIRDISDRKKDEQEITKLSTAVKQSPAAIVITDLKGNIEYSNPRFTELTGYLESELLGKSTSILKSNNHKEVFYKNLWTTISSGKIWRGVFHNMKKDGDLFWETASISPILNNKGIITNYIKIAEDITKKKRNDQIQNVIYNISNAAHTNNNLKQLFGVIQQELGRIIDTTNFYVALYNSEEDTISLPFFVDEYEERTLLPADKTISKYVIKTQKSLLASLQKLKELENAGEIRRYGKDSLIWLGVPLRVEGKVTGVLALQSYTDKNAFDESDMKIIEFVSDQISTSIHRKKIEDVRIESKRRLSTLINNLQGIAYRCKNDGNWTMEYMSAGIKEITGYNAEDIINNKKLPYNELIVPEDRDRIWHEVQLAIEKRKAFEVNYKIKTASGEIRYFSEKGIGIYDDESGELIALEGFINDVTEQKQKEHELITSEQRFKDLYNGLGDAVFVTKVSGENSGNILEVNMAAINQTGYSRDELLKMNIINDLSVKGTGEIDTEAWEEKLLIGETVATVEKKKKKDGTEYWTEMIVTNIDFKGEKASLSINHDITERKRYEHIQKALFQISNAVITTDNLEQLIQLIQLELGAIIDTTNFYVALYEPSNDTISLPFMADEKDIISSFPAGKTLINYVIKTKKPLLANKEKLASLEKSGHIEIFGSDSEIWLGVPLKVEGEVTGVLAVQSYTDKNAYNESDMEILVFVSDQISISIERKRKEQKLLSALEKATESDKLKSAFLATMSHELRTPLNAIIGFSDLINKSLPIEDVYEYATIINSSGNHLLNIVEDLFDITLIESGETKINNKEVEINSFLNDINKAIIIEQNKLEKNNINLNLIIPNSDEKVILFTDSLKLKQIFNNLLKNALKFTHNGHINFGFGIEEIQGKSYCKFYVQDTGIGISKDKHDVIFDIFRQIDDSHTRTYEGTGIGLSISKKLTELLGGKIWLESEEDVGSAFYFTIPYEGKVVIDPKNEKTIVEEGSLKSKTILIVEDDPDSLEFLKILLEMANINSYWAHSGEEAIKYCHENMSIDLVLMDINMSGINGYEATKEIKKFRPKLPIIAQTAYAFGGDKEKALDVGCDDYISKPIDKEELMEMITKLVSD